MNYKLPVIYSRIPPDKKRAVREQYIKEQGGLCFWCQSSLYLKPPSEITSLPINESLFPPKFFESDAHLQHDHNTGLTEGVVHAYCNAVMWQFHNR
jgi:hypothetical protein